MITYPTIDAYTHTGVPQSRFHFSLANPTGLVAKRFTVDATKISQPVISRATEEPVSETWKLVAVANHNANGSAPFTHPQSA